MSQWQWFSRVLTTHSIKTQSAQSYFRCKGLDSFYPQLDIKLADINANLYYGTHIFKQIRSWHVQINSTEVFGAASAGMCFYTCVKIGKMCGTGKWLPSHFHTHHFTGVTAVASPCGIWGPLEALISPQAALPHTSEAGGEFNNGRCH